MAAGVADGPRGRCLGSVDRVGVGLARAAPRRSRSAAVPGDARRSFSGPSRATRALITFVRAALTFWAQRRAPGGCRTRLLHFSRPGRQGHRFVSGRLVYDADCGQPRPATGSRDSISLPCIIAVGTATGPRRSSPPTLLPCRRKRVPKHAVLHHPSLRRPPICAGACEPDRPARSAGIYGTHPGRLAHPGLAQEGSGLAQRIPQQVAQQKSPSVCGYCSPVQNSPTAA